VSPPEPLSGRQRDQLLADAVHQKTRLVLTCRGQQRWETHKSRLLDMAPARRALVVAYPHDTPDGVLQLHRGEQVGVAFRHHSRKCLFAATVVAKRQPRAHSMRASRSKALLLSWPEQIEQLQRRVYYRVAISPQRPVDVRLWSVRTGADPRTPPEDAAVTSGRLIDLSVGGMRVEVQADDDPRLEENQVVSAAFTPDPKAPRLVLDVCFRHAEPTDRGRLSLGFQFIGLEVSQETPSPLSHLARAVARLQRLCEPDRS